MINSHFQATYNRPPVAGKQLRYSADNADPEKQTQNFFATLLGTFNTKGFASSSPVATESVHQASIKSSWENWFDQSGIRHYSFVADAGNPSVRKDKNADDLRAEYGTLLADAYAQGAYATPNAYLRSLSKEQLQLIQQVHHLADPIYTDRLSDEASLNLLLPPPTQVDLDQDGITTVGVGMTLRFPDSNTPSDVRVAWDKATADLSQMDKLMAVAQIKFPLVIANMQTGPDGQVLRVSQPGDANWKNPMAESNFSYLRFANQMLEYIDTFKSQMTPDQYSRDQGFWSSFRNELKKLGHNL
jgi:hypothetical protein